VHEIVKGEEGGIIIVLPLPGGGTVSPDAFKNNAAIGSFREFDFQGEARSNDEARLSKEAWAVAAGAMGGSGFSRASGTSESL